jgi:hypothetical protein
MTNQEILEKAIQKAIAGGWKNGQDWLDTIRSDDAPAFTAKLFIFNHNFAKALWGEKHDALKEWRKEIPDLPKPTSMGWKYHLQQMVIAPDPIKYLGEHL